MLVMSILQGSSVVSLSMFMASIFFAIHDVYDTEKREMLDKVHFWQYFISIIILIFVIVNCLSLAYKDGIIQFFVAGLIQVMYYLPLTIMLTSNCLFPITQNGRQIQL